MRYIHRNCGTISKLNGVEFSVLINVQNTKDGNEPEIERISDKSVLNQFN